MQKIPLELANSAMRSAKNILLRDGSCLVRKGEALDSAVVQRLSLRDVPHVVVEGAPLHGYDMGYDPQAVAQRLPFLFRKFVDDAPMMRISALFAELLTDRVLH